MVRVDFGRRCGASWARGLLLATLCASPLFAQRTWEVGIGVNTFVEIQDAILAARAGDVVLVQPGTYANFVDDKGVTIRAKDGPNTVFVVARELQPVSPNSLPSAQTFLRAPSGETTRLVDLDFPPSSLLVPVPGIRLFTLHSIALQGDAVFEGCRVLSTQPSGAISNGGLGPRRRLALIDTDVSPGLSLFGADLSMSGGSISGISTTEMNRPATPAISVGFSNVHLSGVTLHAGVAVTRSMSAPAIELRSSSTLWMTDCVLTGDPTVCGVALDPSGSSSSTFARTTFSGLQTGCANGLQIADLVGLTRTGRFGTSPPFGAPQTFDGQLDITALANSSVVLALSGDLSPRTMPAVHRQPLWLPLDRIVPLATLQADGQGNASFSFSVPYTPALEGLQLWFQAVGVSGLPVELSPLCGGSLTR